MHTRLVEALSEGKNGHFMVARFNCEEWTRGAAKTDRSVLLSRGWSLRHLFVLDVTTGEGFLTLHGGDAHADCERHQIWVTSLFEPFLAWLYEQDLLDLGDELEALPEFVALPAPLAPLPVAIDRERLVRNGLPICFIREHA